MTFDAKEKSIYGSQPQELYKFTRGGLFTSSDTALTYLSETYFPETITREAVDQSNEDTAGSVVITVPRDNAVARLFIPYLPVEPVGLTIYATHRDDSEYVPVFIGKIGSAVFDGSEARLTAMPVGEVLRRPVPSIAYQVPCNHALYGPGCTLDKELFRVIGTVAAVAGTVITASAFASKPAGWFKTGFVRKSNGDIRFIVDSSGSTITLMNPFPELAIGESVSAYAGCDRTESTCENKFNNLVNHMGWARIPTLNPFNTDLSGTGGSGGAGGNQNTDLIKRIFTMGAG